MKKLIVLFTSLIITLTTLMEYKTPVYVEYFKPNQILLPDYVCIDTLVVVDHIGLNKAYGLLEQGIIDDSDWGDDQYDSLMHTYCIIKQP